MPVDGKCEECRKGIGHFLHCTQHPDYVVELPDFVTVEGRTGTSARGWCDKCEYGSDGWVSPREAFDWAYTHVKENHVAKKKLEESECRNCGKPIYYSGFVGCWLHWESAARECTSSVAEPKE